MNGLESILGVIEGVGAAFITFYLVALGHSIFEKAGLLDLAIDGIFFMSTGAAVLGAVMFGNPIAGSLIAALVASLFGLLMAYLLTTLPISHGAVGLSLQFLGYGVGIVLGYPVRQQVGALYAFCYSQEALLEISGVALLLGLFIHYLIEKTKLGAAIRASGENPHAASALGVNVLVTRLIAAAIGFAIVGLGASFFPLLWQRYWDIKVYTLGYGWLAFTIALAAGRHPIFLLPMALLFGGLVEYSVTIQSMLKLPADVAKLIPFVGALGAMLAYSFTKLGRIFASPQSLGKVYYKEEKTV
uniref:Ribose ABC transporter permease n=1 Tax=Thermosphaera aggregans TaxID=54254 RepID=A0A7C2FYR7_9CREN